MRLLLDTSGLIDHSRGREPARSYILARIAGGDELGISVINLAEFYAGVPMGANPTIDAFVASLTLWDVSRAIALRAGAYRYALARRGRTISLQDALIAATAHEHGAALVTANVRDFPMADIQVIAL
jgi:predicted nucleic acid-binding protein